MTRVKYGLKFDKPPLVLNITGEVFTED